MFSRGRVFLIIGCLGLLDAPVLLLELENTAIGWIWYAWQTAITAPANY